MTKTKKETENKAFLARSAKTGEFFKKQGLVDLSDVVKYAIKKSSV